MALALMYYVAPARRLAATVIWACACGIGLLLLFTSYALHPEFLSKVCATPASSAERGVRFSCPERTGSWSRNWPKQPGSCRRRSRGGCDVFGLATRAVFGNTAPLLVALIFLLLAVATPHYPGLGFNLIAVPFLFVFVAGITADLLETPQRGLVLLLHPRPAAGQRNLESLGTGSRQRRVTIIDYRGF